MKTDKCTVCDKEFSAKRSLRRHKQAVHKQYIKNNSFVCHECGYERSRVIELENHMRENHLSFRHPCCLYCNNFFVDDSLYIEHMNKVHGLPVWTAGAKIDQSEENVATEKAFDGVLKICNISADNNDIDLLSFMRSQQNNIQKALRLNTQFQPQKVQFCATIELTKPVEEVSPKTSVDHITIFANSKSQWVDFSGLSNECFSEITEQMMLALNNFSSHGSCWSFNQVKNVELRLAITKPNQSSSK